MNIKPKAVGGQAVIEGVMMKGAEDIAIAVRKPDGEIVVKKEKLKSNRKKISKIPIIRGMFTFVDSMVLGVNALLYSAEFVDVEEEEKKKASKLDEFLEKNIIWISVVISIVFSVGLFILLPTVLVGIFKAYIDNTLILNGIEGIVRIAIFLGYILAISGMKDIRRVFEYHGAEHKSIFCYEHGEELTVENVRKYGRLHPRCGTSFLFIVMIVSILLFSLFSWSGVLMRLLIRILLIPIVAGISYEIIKWAGKSESKLSCIVSAPGMWLQKLTTREPDDKQIEVAVEALKNVLVPDPEADNW
ncbi:MAG TPA: DUF1385 domain-containing protein [Bacillota bacterium]|jgi:uncharacterized protein YqhQ|nr:DUF1385 domain-containing protein [Bacillota bacterium]HOS70410.1 DUF1385 domain-containing protein [Bacillota bacterium]HQJ36495.1 DUF1385 domain-containing protein [Bacillota bacterium]HQL36489.1 DUF1385 domain-containing protein [Bacillota bacterium]HQQ45771.1 DUF1385 domain-containing protein [Bacillota bacterium]